MISLKHISLFTFLFCFALFTSCKPKTDKTVATQINQTPEENKANEIIDKAIEVHGGENYKNSLYSFEFRGKEYRFINQKNSYEYSVKSMVNYNEIVDVIENGAFSRKTNDLPTILNTNENLKYASALNSVIYFALLPYKLNDASVNKTYKGMVSMKGKNYHTIEVTFDQEGGGEDHDDVFYYWINTTTNTVDYLAYKYHVNGGGIRFREAFNTRNVQGVLFQDYINYKTPTQVTLADLSTLFNKNKLIEVSRIELKNIKHIETSSL